MFSVPAYGLSGQLRMTGPQLPGSRPYQWSCRYRCSQGGALRLFKDSLRVWLGGSGERTSGQARHALRANTRPDATCDLDTASSSNRSSSTVQKHASKKCESPFEPPDGKQWLPWKPEHAAMPETENPNSSQTLAETPPCTGSYSSMTAQLPDCEDCTSMSIGAVAPPTAAVNISSPGAVAASSAGPQAAHVLVPECGKAGSAAPLADTLARHTPCNGEEPWADQLSDVLASETTRLKAITAKLADGSLSSTVQFDTSPAHSKGSRPGQPAPCLPAKAVVGDKGPITILPPTCLSADVDVHVTEAAPLKIPTALTGSAVTAATARDMMHPDPAVCTVQITACVLPEVQTSPADVDMAVKAAVCKTSLQTDSMQQVEAATTKPVQAHAASVIDKAARQAASSTAKSVCSKRNGGLQQITGTVSHCRTQSPAKRATTMNVQPLGATTTGPAVSVQTATAQPQPAVCLMIPTPAQKAPRRTVVTDSSDSPCSQTTVRTVDLDGVMLSVIKTPSREVLTRVNKQAPGQVASHSQYIKGTKKAVLADAEVTVTATSVSTATVPPPGKHQQCKQATDLNIPQHVAGQAERVQTIEDSSTVQCSMVRSEKTMESANNSTAAATGSIRHCHPGNSPRAQVTVPSHVYRHTAGYKAGCKADPVAGQYTAPPPTVCASATVIQGSQQVESSKGAVAVACKTLQVPAARVLGWPFSTSPSTSDGAGRKVSAETLAAFRTDASSSAAASSGAVLPGTTRSAAVTAPVMKQCSVMKAAGGANSGEPDTKQGVQATVQLGHSPHQTHTKLDSALSPAARQESITGSRLPPCVPEHSDTLYHAELDSNKKKDLVEKHGLAQSVSVTAHTRRSPQVLCNGPAVSQKCTLAADKSVHDTTARQPAGHVQGLAAESVQHSIALGSSKHQPSASTDPTHVMPDAAREPTEATSHQVLYNQVLYGAAQNVYHGPAPPLRELDIFTAQAHHMNAAYHQHMIQGASAYHAFHQEQIMGGVMPQPWQMTGHPASYPWQLGPHFIHQPYGNPQPGQVWPPWTCSSTPSMQPLAWSHHR